MSEEKQPKEAFTLRLPVGLDTTKEEVLEKLELSENEEVIDTEDDTENEELVDTLAVNTKDALTDTEEVNE